MPKTINTFDESQIIGGTFSKRENAAKAVEAFRELGYSPAEIQILDESEETPFTATCADLLSKRGCSKTQALYYNEFVREGHTLVVVYEVLTPAPVIDIFDHHKAEYNPNGSRNLRQDVLGMTAGAVAGAAALGAVGAAMGGSIGAFAGAATGAVVGGSSGAAAGKSVEHHK